MTTRLSLIILFSCFLTIRGQVVPPLPPLSSPSPPPSPSPLPSALADLLASLTPEPSAIPVDPPTTATPPPPPPSGTTAPGATESMLPTPGMTTSPLQSPIPSSSPPIPSVSPSPSGSEFINEDGVCERDVDNPRPVLGKSQARYAISVLLSAAAVALASIFYGMAYDWEPEKEHIMFRLGWILIARILIIGAIKVSAALVASITKASPDDGALDASGAFLTWGSAIMTKLFYEGFKMTMAALEFTDNQSVWDDKLKEFLSVEEPYNGSEDGQRGLLSLRAKSQISIFKRLFGGRSERRLLLVTAVLHFTSEITSLSLSLLDLVGGFSGNPDTISYFSSDGLGGQCGISGKDGVLLIGLIVTQSLYSISEQPSLVPLLTVTAFCPKYNNRPKVNLLLSKLRYVSYFVLFTWVTTLLCLPLFVKPIQPLVVAGDLSLFWYIIIGSSPYLSIGFIITATYSCFAAVVGAYIIYGISQDQKQQEAEPEATCVVTHA